MKMKKTDDGWYKLGRYEAKPYLDEEKAFYLIPIRWEENGQWECDFSYHPATFQDKKKEIELSYAYVANATLQLFRFKHASKNELKD